MTHDLVADTDRAGRRIATRVSVHIDVIDNGTDPPRRPLMRRRGRDATCAEDASEVAAGRER